MRKRTLFILAATVLGTLAVVIMYAGTAASSSAVEPSQAATPSPVAFGDPTSPAR